MHRKLMSWPMMTLVKVRMGRYSSQVLELWWERHVLQFVIFGISFTAKLDSRRYPPVMWPTLLNYSGNRLRGCIIKWGERERNMMRQGLEMVGRPIIRPGSPNVPN